ncbi:hypothetical protein J6590_008541 [Homalodisca vitripennis]|nr:hypothetical protein J6590_008541 [Homalodisca vitripennis]
MECLDREADSGIEQNQSVPFCLEWRGRSFWSGKMIPGEGSEALTHIVHEIFAKFNPEYSCRLLIVVDNLNLFFFLSFESGSAKQQNSLEESCLEDILLVSF